MNALPYLLIVLFNLNDGSLISMSTSQGFASPLSCSMRAFLENETARDRTYVCVTQEHAAKLANRSVGPSAANVAPRANP